MNVLLVEDEPRVADFIDRALMNRESAMELSKVRAEVAEFCKRFPMPH